MLPNFATWSKQEGASLSRGTEDFYRACALFPDHLHEDTLAASSIEFAVENLFPWTEI
jgi:hypothetical protein